jgi:hypothetical protein
MRFYPSFIFCTTLYACLGLLSLNSCSVAINCWLVTCLFFFLHAVCAHFLFFAYSALFTLVGQAKYAWFCLICLLQQLSALFIIPFLVILVPFLISRYVNCCVFLYLFDWLPLYFWIYVDFFFYFVFCPGPI